MRRGLVVWVAVGVIGLGGAMLVACASSSPSTGSRPSPSQLSDGLTVLDAKAGWGVNAAFKASGHVVYLETRVGPLKPQVYRDSFPNDPPHEVDVRFVDEYGNTFRIQRGGDMYVDPSWVADMKAPKMVPLAKVSASETDTHFKLARDAATALAGAGLGADFSESIVNVTGFAHRIPSELPEMTVRARTMAPVLPEKAYSTDGNWNWFDGDEYGGCVDWFCVGHHGAVAMWNCLWTGNSSSPCNWNLEVSACNHGRCPWDSGMSYNCSSGAYAWTYNAEVDTLNLQSPNQDNSGTGVNGACWSGYNWDTPPGHECNDDSAYELWQVKNSSASTQNGDGWSFHWNDSKGHNYECNCGQYGNCSGDWQNPACP